MKFLSADSPAFPITYGAIHALVDAATVMVVYTAVARFGMSVGDGFRLVLGYDLLAFAGQALIGLASDHLRAPMAAARAGIVCAGCAVAMLFWNPYAAMALAGLGNALYHVGGGAMSLTVRPGRATDPGLFVGPGAIGLATGIWMGKSGAICVWPFLAALAASLLVTLVSGAPRISYSRQERRLELSAPVVVAALLLVSIAVRAFVGTAGAQGLDKAPWVTVAVTAAVFGGKTLGGIASDRLGWIPVNVGALVLSAPLIAFGGRDPLIFAAGIFLFQMTMPATLVALAALLPGRPGFAFGLACLGLIGGALPAFFRVVKAHYSAPSFLALILLSAACLFAALFSLRGKLPMRYRTVDTPPPEPLIH